MIYTLTSDIFDIFTMNIFFNTIFQKRNKNIPYPIFISFFVLYEFIGFITNSYFNLSGSKHLYIVSLVSILTIFLLTFLYNANLKLRLLSAISYHILGGLSEVVIYIIISYFPKEDRAKILSQNGICLAISQILFFVFMILPTLNVFRMSLFEKGAYSPNETFVGLKNFKTLISDTNFIRSMQNMILLIVVVTIVTFAFALVFAGILSREQIRGQNFFRIIFYIPNILSVVVIAGIFSAIYKPENGMLNSIIGLFHKMENPILWKGESLVIVSLIIAMIWQAIGYYMVMYMASMASVPKSLYESAGLDGAGRLVQFFQITIPLIWTNIRTTLTFFIISTINMAFLFVKAMTSGGPNGASEVSLSYMYGQKDAGLYGYSMAIGVVIFIFSFALSALVNKVTEREPLEF